ncbi:Transcriptional regulator, TetR family protein [Minicystis rosea]|nr:Transcriptional regulator, TetR family protein [Minicystis rosea]
MLRPSPETKPRTTTDPTDPAGEGALAEAAPGLPAKRERNAAVTKQRILDAGEREFAARGFAGARLREIAETAGVQPALIHHYFTDKHGLYRQVLDRALLPSSAESWTLLSSGLDLEGLVTGLIEVLLRFYAKHHNLLAILRHDASSGSPVQDELVRERILPIVEAVTALLSEWQRAGELRADVPPAEIIAAGLGLVAFPFVEEGLVRVMLPSIVTKDEDAIQQRKSAIVTMLLSAVRPLAKVEAVSAVEAKAPSEARPAPEAKPKSSGKKTAPAKKAAAKMARAKSSK